MKINLLFFLLFALVTSCNQSPSKKVNETNLKTFFASKVKEVDSTMSIETFSFIKLDTTSLRNQYIQIFNAMMDKAEQNNYELKLLIEKIKTNRRLQGLTSDLSYALWKNYKDDADEDTKKAQAILATDSLLQIDINKVDTLLKKADSVKPIFYIAKCAYTLKKRDQSISRDTVRIRLDLDYNILDNIEYSKYLNKLYIPISDFKNE